MQTSILAATDAMLRMAFEMIQADREMRRFVATMPGPDGFRRMRRAERRRLRMMLPAHQR